MADIRSALEAAFEKHEGGGEEVLDKDNRPEEEDKVELVVEEKPEPEGKPETKPEGEKKADPPAPVIPTAAKKPGTLPPGPAKIKPPASWRPQAREKFSTVDPEIQAEVTRREAEIDRGLREASEARRFHTAFAQVSQPYQAMFAAENTNAVSAAGDMFRHAYVLRQGTPQQKAQMVAELLHHFNVDVSLVDTLLAAKYEGKPPPNDPTLAAVQQALAPIQQFMQQQTQQRQGAEQYQIQQLQSEIDSFANDPANEFFEDVRQDVADLMQLSANRGQVMSLSEAYRRATLAHPEVSVTLQARQDAAKRREQTEKARKAKAAGASVSGGAPSEQEGIPKVVKGNRVSAIEAAWETVAARE